VLHLTGDCVQIAILTPLDKFILGHLGFLFVVALENALVALVAHPSFAGAPISDDVFREYQRSGRCPPTPTGGVLQSNCEEVVIAENERWVESTCSAIETAFFCLMGPVWVLLHAAAGVWAYRRSKFVPSSLANRPQPAGQTGRTMTKALIKMSSFELRAEGGAEDGDDERKTK
jgi:hypothetical protein